MNLREVFEKRFNPEEEYLGLAKEINSIEPYVSVCIATYQHEKFISKCIESVLEQETNFPIEILIGEDQGPDDTRKICLEFAEKNPDRIRLFLRDRSTSQLLDDEGKFVARFNGRWLRKSARGKYIALCEGDDYWDDPLKLQKQVEFLDQNPAYVISYHDARIVDENDKLIASSKLKKESRKKDYSINQMVQGKLLPTMSVVFRNLIKEGKINDLHPVKNGDRLLFALLGQYGKAHYSGEVSPAVYRVHSGGIWSKTDMMSRKKDLVNTSEVIHLVVNEQFKTLAKNELFARRLHLAREYMKMRQYSKFWLHYKVAFSEFAFNLIFIKHFIKENLKILFSLILGR